MNPIACYEAGYEAGMHCDDRCPHFPFTPQWWCWHAGNFAGHQMLCATMETLYLMDVA